MLKSKKVNKVLITGTAGFIGFHVANRLISDDYKVIGLDNINDYYDKRLKFGRLKEHGIEANKIKENKITKSEKFENYQFIKADIADHDFIVKFMLEQKFDFVINLAAQAGVRYSIDNPRSYTHSNINGFLSILEGSRQTKVKNLIYASSSSVYGLNQKMPLSENDSTDYPMAMYAATKKANEVMAHSYSHLYNLPTIGLRFFTVYGPWGRPDMALFIFSDALINQKTVNVFNKGQMVRDFTYIDDIVECILRLIKKPAQSNPNLIQNKLNLVSYSAPYQIFNVGNSSPVKLMDYIETLEKEFGKRLKKSMKPLQPGDVLKTHADIKSLENFIGFRPKTTIDYGVKRFVEWYKSKYLNI